MCLLEAHDIWLKTICQENNTVLLEDWRSPWQFKVIAVMLSVRGDAIIKMGLSQIKIALHPRVEEDEPNQIM